jgi:hypothetical protein
VKRLLLLVAVLLLAGCASDDPVLTVDGAEILDQDGFDAFLEPMVDEEDFLTQVEGRGTHGGDGTLRSGFAVTILTYHVLDDVVSRELGQRGVEVTDADLAAAEEILGEQLAEVPEPYQSFLIELQTEIEALRTDVDDEAELNELLGRLLTDVEVDVAEKYGRWDPDQGEVVPPEGPAERE